MPELPLGNSESILKTSSYYQYFTTVIKGLPVLLFVTVIHYFIFAYNVIIFSEEFFPDFQTESKQFYFNTLCANQSQADTSLVYNNFKGILDKSGSFCVRKPCISSTQVRMLIFLELPSHFHDMYHE